MHRSEDAPATAHSDNKSEVVSGSILDSITGRVEIAAGSSVPVGETITLSLHDGNKLKVITEPDGRVTGIGAFFR